jgi:hypothetical protein
MAAEAIRIECHAHPLQVDDACGRLPNGTAMFCIGHVVGERGSQPGGENPADDRDLRPPAGLLIGAVAGVGLQLLVGAVTGMLS